jgi:MFS family permease
VYNTKHLRKLTGATILANILTWYEFSLFSDLASYMSPIFFPENGGSLPSLIQVFLFYAISFISRPFGVLFFAQIGDRAGRKPALLLSVILITIPSIITAFIPSFATIGIAAPLLLALMRFIQGFCIGGEITGSMCYLYEISPVKLRPFFGALTFLGSQIGHVLCFLQFLLIEHFFSYEVMIDIGWRISFLIGGVMGLFGWYLRSQISETLLFETEMTEGKISNAPLLESLKEHKMGLFKAFLLSSLTVASWYMLYFFVPTYLKTVLKLSIDQITSTNIAILLLSTSLLPIFGFLGTTAHKKRLFMISTMGVLFFSYPLCLAAVEQSYLLFIAIQLILVAFLTIQFALLPSMLCGMFPLKVRYSCVGLSYNLSNLVFGTTIPLLALTFTMGRGHLLAPAFLMSFAAVISFLAYNYLKKAEQKSAL